MSSALQKYASETTAHGVVHLTGERRTYVKAVWLVAVLLSLGYCAYKVHTGAILRYSSGEFTTTINGNSLDFEFPDVYFCNESPISGSYSVTLSDEDNQQLRKYKDIVKANFAKLGSYRENEISETYAAKLINTLPFQFLSNKMANQKNQSILQFYFNGNYIGNFNTFHHPLFMNCFKSNFSNEEFRILQNPSMYAQTVFFIDPQLPPSFDNSTPDFIKINGMTMELKPRSWDFDYGFDSMRPAGIRVIMTPRGQYPSDLDTSLTVGPGLFHGIQIKMQDTLLNAEDFAGRCKDNRDTNTAKFVNPYSLQSQSFTYSHAICWYHEVARLSHEMYNCSVWRLPLPWKYRSLPSCFNLTEFEGNITLSSALYAERHQILQDATLSCAPYVPCRMRTYSYQYSSSSWPADENSFDFTKGYSMDEPDDKPTGFEPGKSFLLRNSSFQQFRESVLQIELSAAEFKSQEIVVGLAYDFNSLIADVGGLIGLFLGMSLMSVLELVELLHDCVLTAWQRQKRVTGGTNCSKVEVDIGVQKVSAG